MTQPLAEAIRALFPRATPGVDYIVMDDGTGAVLAQWRLPGPQPTQAQLDAAPIPLNTQIRADADFQALIAALDTATPAQIKALATGASGLPEIKALLAKVLLLLALQHR